MVSRSDARNKKLNVRQFYKQSDLKKTRRYLEGVCILISTTQNTQKYYHITIYFPVTLILQLEQNGFMGLNFHYIPPRYRILLLSELYKFAINEDDESDDMQTRIRISYDILKAAQKFKWAKPCLKRYLSTQVMGPALEVTPDHWDTIVMLPLARFQKQTVRSVYADSRRMVNGR